MRIIALKVGSYIGPLFLDPYHLIYPNENFNEDYKNFSFCNPTATKRDLTIISIDEEILKECIECPKFESITSIGYPKK